MVSQEEPFENLCILISIDVGIAIAKNLFWHYEFYIEI